MAERQQVAERLYRALVEGCIDVAEFDERTIAVYASRTRDDLAVPTVDLPLERPEVITSLMRCDGQSMRYRALDAATVVWLMASMISLVIWGLICVGQQRLVDPWWIWTVGPAGGVLLTLWFAAYRHGE